MILLHWDLVLLLFWSNTRSYLYCIHVFISTFLVQTVEPIYIDNVLRLGPRERQPLQKYITPRCFLC